MFQDVLEIKENLLLLQNIRTILKHKLKKKMSNNKLFFVFDFLSVSQRATFCKNMPENLVTTFNISSFYKIDFRNYCFLI